MTEYSLLIAGEMGINKQNMEVLKFAALLHDIGKIGIRDEVLLKNGPFTPEERAEMNTHPVKTKTILDKFRFSKVLQEVPEIAAYHHEKINGQGYPNGLTGDRLPLGSKIMAVADVFDALTSRRDYPKHVSGETLDRDPMPLAKAISILEDEAGSHFAPDVVAAFLRCLPRVLLLHRGDHFPPEYVDDTIRSLAPDLLP
ncbi:MAG: HD domain-containing protein [Proteobacteria bacterium]|nr:HD domain-containing protein [Pseudomonadota bacterium]